MEETTVNDNKTQTELDAQELEDLRTQLTLLNVQYHPRAGLATLRTLLQTALAEPEEKDLDTQAKPSSKISYEKAIKMEALKPVLCKITCVNNDKSSHYGQKFYFGNSVTGRCCDFIPFGNSDGVSEPIVVPKMLVNILKNRKFVKTTPLPNHKYSPDGRNFTTQWVPEFVIEVIKEYDY